MSLKETISFDLRDALKNKEASKLTVLRMLLSAIQSLEIEKRGDGGFISDNDVMSVLMSEAKKRSDAIDLYTKGGREDLASSEKEELEIIKKYLPKEVSEEEVASFVDDLIKKGEKDFGPLMKSVMEKFKGRTDGKIVSKIVKEKLD